MNDKIRDQIKDCIRKALQDKYVGKNENVYGAFLAVTADIMFDFEEETLGWKRSDYIEVILEVMASLNMKIS